MATFYIKEERMKKGLLNFLGSDSGFGFNNNSAYYIKDTRIIIFD